MEPYEIIVKKRDGLELNREELAWFIDAYTNDSGVADYHAAAFLMAVFFRGMTATELAHWTDAMLHSGDVLDLSCIDGVKVDKHSTGGVGDKVSLPLAALVAEAGVPVPMISGRGLGHTGGTLDKLESIPGLRTDLSAEQFKTQVASIGCALAGQTGQLAPADKKLYALRDVTGTVACIPLIASSIMSKKLAAGIDGLVLDVKVGSGAFMQTLEDARTLAKTMIGIGQSMAKTVVAHITDMEQPLGNTVGNSIEVKEAIETLKGNGPDDLLDVTLTLAADMLVIGGVEPNHAEGLKHLQRLIASGAALERFKRVVEAQGGDPRVVDDPSRLPTAPYQRDVVATAEGVISKLDARIVGQVARALGAGRKNITDSVDFGAGIALKRKVGDGVEKGTHLATLFSSDESALERAEIRFLSSLELSPKPGPVRSLLIDRLDEGL